MSARSIARVPARARRVVLTLAGALAMTLSYAPVAWAQARPGTLSQPAPATATTATTPATPATTTPSHACRKAKARVAGEERSIGKVQRSIDKASTGSTKCSTKPVCDQYATKITELETLRTRRDAKLVKYRAAADKACAPK